MHKDRILPVMRVLVCLTFLGRAWQHLRWDAPFRGLLWKQAWMEPIVSWFSISWRDWVSHASFDVGIQNSIRLFGLFYLVCAVVALVVKREHLKMQFLLGLGGTALFFLGFLYFLEKGMRVGQWMEYTLQFSAPFFLIAALRGHMVEVSVQRLLKIAIALTFVGHGLYAAGIYPMPGHFVTMLMQSTGLSEDLARQFLVFFGYMDFLVAGALFVPKLDRFALYYIIFWGFATALARLVAYHDLVHPISWLDSWLYQCLFRLVHGGMPLVLLLAIQRKTGGDEAGGVLAFGLPGSLQCSGVRA